MDLFWEIILIFIIQIEPPGLKSAAETRQKKKKTACGIEVWQRDKTISAKNNLQSHVPRKVGLISENWLLMFHL